LHANGGDSEAVEVAEKRNVVKHPFAAYNQGPTSQLNQSEPMPGNNLRSNRGRDPLAEVARLIAQADPYSERASGDAYQVGERYSQVGERHMASPPSAPSCSHAAQERRYESESAGSRYFSASAAQINDYQRDEAALPLPGHQLTYATAPAYETTPGRSYELAEEHYNDKAYPVDDAACGADEGYTDTQSTRRRSSLVLVLALLGLAMVGAAGAFGYRVIFGGPVPPTLPLVGKADKIAPVSAASEAMNATNTNQAGATITGSSEDLVSREEQEEQSVKPDPRVISTIGWLSGAATPVAPTLPAAVQMAPNQATSDRVASVWPAPPAMTAPTDPAAVAPIPAPAPQVSSEPKKVRTVTYRTDPSGTVDTKPELTPPAAPIAVGNAQSTALVVPSVSGGGFAVQVTSERNESNAQAALQALLQKYPNQLSGRQPIIRRADLGAKGVYYRVLVGPFASAEEAAGLCSKLKAAGGNCIVQTNLTPSSALAGRVLKMDVR
jgi:SPOR domain